MVFTLRHRWLWDNNWLNIYVKDDITAAEPARSCLCWTWPFIEAVHHWGRGGPSRGREEEGRSRGRLTDGLSEWIIDRGLLTDAGSINSSKPAWWITADKQCWVSKCVFNNARWKYYSFFAEPQTSDCISCIHLRCILLVYSGARPSNGSKSIKRDV